MSLETPIQIRTLQRKLYLKAKAEPACRFYYYWVINARLVQDGSAMWPIVS